MQASESKEFYLSEFRHFENNGAKKNPTWLRELRTSAIESFQKLGFPTTHDEDWKYTSVDRITSVAFAHGNGNVGGVSADVISDLACAGTDCNRLVFVNGGYSPELSFTSALPDSVRVENLAAVLKSKDEFLARYLGRYARTREQPFVALNTAFIEDGALVFVRKDGIAAEPIHLIYVSTANGKPIASQPRNLLILEDGSEARIVENYIGLGPGTYLTNAVTELIAGENSKIEHYRLQREGVSGSHVGTLDAQLKRNCNFTAHAITLGGGLVRNDVHVVLDGEGSDCVLNGLYLMDGKQHVDNSTEIEHVKPRATSFELYKGILSGSARGVFNGKIRVHKDAQRTNARQVNKNLLLSADAMVNTKPQLEIYADDVKCSHGSTIGQLDRDALFYLRSRGIGQEDAQSLLSYAFASDVINRIKIDYLRARLDEYLLNKFRRTSGARIP